MEVRGWERFRRLASLPDTIGAPVAHRARERRRGVIAPTLRNVRQGDAVKIFERWGGVVRRRTKRGHCVIKMPNGKIVSLPTGVIKVGLLTSQIKLAGHSEDEFVDAL